MGPKAVFTPRIAMVCADQNVRVFEEAEHPFKLGINPLETSRLTSTALVGVIVIRKLAARIYVHWPVGAFVPVRGVGFSDVHEDEHGALDLGDLLVDEIDLSS